MRMTIVVPDSTVYIDGYSLKIDLTSHDVAGMHAVQWHNNHGWIEWADGSRNTEITDINRFISIVEQYELEKARIDNPPPPTLDDAKTFKVAELKLAAETEAYSYIAEYPEFETKTWPSQEAEALAYVEDANAPTPTISGIMVGRNISEPYKAAFVEKILEKADA